MVQCGAVLSPQLHLARLRKVPVSSLYMKAGIKGFGDKWTGQNGCSSFGVVYFLFGGLGDGDEWPSRSCFAKDSVEPDSSRLRAETFSTPRSWAANLRDCRPWPRRLDLPSVTNFNFHEATISESRSFLPGLANAEASDKQPVSATCSEFKAESLFPFCWPKSSKKLHHPSRYGTQQLL